jgi:hypothetical protein
VIKGKAISDNPVFAGFTFDGLPNTVYYSNNSACYVGVDFGSDSYAFIQSLNYMPNPAWSMPAVKL